MPNHPNLPQIRITIVILKRPVWKNIINELMVLWLLNMSLNETTKNRSINLRPLLKTTTMVIYIKPSNVSAKNVYTHKEIGALAPST